MEGETMLNDDGQTGHAAPKGRNLPKGRNKRKVNLLQLGIGCLVIAFLAILITVAIVKLMPTTQKSVSTTEKKGDIQEIAFKATFSTNYIPGNERQPLDITNIDDITDQLNTKVKDN
jgi:uncharacterized membrane protein YhiD involved in acid resistance